MKIHLSRSNTHKTHTTSQSSQRVSCGAHIQSCFDRRSMLVGRFKSTCVQSAGMQQLSSTGHTHTPQTHICVNHIFIHSDRKRQKTGAERPLFYFHDNVITVSLLFLLTLWKQYSLSKQLFSSNGKSKNLNRRSYLIK